MASVRRRTWMHNGTERSAWACEYTDMGGKRRRKHFKDKKSADRYRRTVETELEAGSHVAAAE